MRTIINKSVKRLGAVARRWSNHCGSYDFRSRAKNAEVLVLILAGYKPVLWPYTLERMRRFLPSWCDVCLVSSGKYDNALGEWARESHWSYLSTADNHVSLAQNIAIRQFPKAKWIIKLDEDIFINARLAEKLLDGYLRVCDEGLYHPGICSPLINVNGCAYVRLLKILGLEEEYKKRFGELISAATGIKMHKDGEAAKWIWNQTLPLSATEQLLESRPFEYSTAPHLFSIGAILFERGWLDELGGLPVNLKDRARMHVPLGHSFMGSLGSDENFLNVNCVMKSRPVIILHNVLVGHLSFFPQYSVMEQFLPELASRLDRGDPAKEACYRAVSEESHAI